MDEDDAILSCVHDKFNFSEPAAGFHTVKVGAGYVVLSMHENSRPKYVGWFKATTTHRVFGDRYYHDSGWIYCGEYDGLQVYRRFEDSKPDSVIVSIK